MDPGGRGYRYLALATHMVATPLSKLPIRPYSSSASPNHGEQRRSYFTHCRLEKVNQPVAAADQTIIVELIGK